MGLSAGTVYVDVKPDTSAMSGKGKGGLGGAMKAAGILAAGAFAVSFAKESLGEAKESEKVGKQMADSFSRGTEHFSSDAMGSFFDSINNSMGVSDEALDTFAVHLNNAIDFSKFKNPTKALQDMTLDVVNMAAATGKSQSAMEKMMVKVGTDPGGSAKMLQKLGMLTADQTEKVKDLVKKGKLQAATELELAAIHEKTAGAQAAQATDSEKLSVAVGELKEKIGGFLLPAINALSSAGTKFITWLTEGGAMAKVLVGVVGALVAVMIVHKAITTASTIATKAQYVWTMAVKGATAAWTASQWLLNAAMSANPIGLIVAGVVALIAVIVVLWKKNETFRKIVTAVWNGIKRVIVGVWHGIQVAGGLVFKALGLYVKAWWAVISGVFRVAKSAFEKLWDPLQSGARLVFNAIASLWNNSIGKLSFHVPSWVPKIGGSGFDVPDIPLMANGGIVNQPTLAMIGEAGSEAVIPLDRGGMTVRIVDSNLGLVMSGQLEKDHRYAEARGRVAR